MTGYRWQMACRKDIADKRVLRGYRRKKDDVDIKNRRLHNDDTFDI